MERASAQTIKQMEKPSGGENWGGWWVGAYWHAVGTMRGWCQCDASISLNRGGALENNFPLPTDLTHKSIHKQTPDDAFQGSSHASHNIMMPADATIFTNSYWILCLGLLHYSLETQSDQNQNHTSLIIFFQPNLQHWSTLFLTKQWWNAKDILLQLAEVASLQPRVKLRRILTTATSTR
jgi:hypothetical protein